MEVNYGGYAEIKSQVMENLLTTNIRATNLAFMES